MGRGGGPEGGGGSGGGGGVKRWSDEYDVEIAPRPSLPPEVTSVSVTIEEHCDIL